MMHALTQNNQITHVGPLPRIWWDGDRWHDLRDDDGTQAAALGWLPLTTEPRPADTDTTTHGYSVQLVDGVPTVVWTPRDWTAEELAARAEQEARLDDHEARLQRIEAVLWPADPEPDGQTLAPVWADYGGVWPNGKLLDDGGTVWRNVAGVPLTTPPSGFPGTPSQWSHLFEPAVVEPEPEPDPSWPQWRGTWSPAATYTAGDHAERDGTVYRCLVPHGPEQQGTWGPPTTGVWTIP